MNVAWVVCALGCTSALGAQAWHASSPVGVRARYSAGSVARPALGFSDLARRTGDAGQPFLQTSTVDADTPPLEPARIAGQVLAGAYAGMGGFFIGSRIGSAVVSSLPVASEGRREQIAFAFGVAGATVATAASVSVVGNVGDQTGSYHAAAVGTLTGVAVGLLLNQMLYGHARLPSEEGSSRIRWIEASLEALLPSIGATIAFNSTRSYK